MYHIALLFLWILITDSRYLLNTWRGLFFGMANFRGTQSENWKQKDKPKRGSDAKATEVVSSRGGVRTDIGLSYALAYFCPDKSSVSSLRPVSSCREAPANCKTGIFPTARCNHDITVCPVSLQPIMRRTHQHDTPASYHAAAVYCPYRTSNALSVCSYILYLYIATVVIWRLYGSIYLPRSILLHQL